MSARNGEDSSDRPRHPRLSVSALRRGVLTPFSLDKSHVRIVLLMYPCVSSKTVIIRLCAIHSESMLYK